MPSKHKLVHSSIKFGRVEGAGLASTLLPSVLHAHVCVLRFTSGSTWFQQPSEICSRHGWRKRAGRSSRQVLVSENVVALAVEFFTRPPIKAWGAVRKRACSAPSQCGNNKYVLCDAPLSIADFLLDLRGFLGYDTRCEHKVGAYVACCSSFGQIIWVFGRCLEALRGRAVCRSCVSMRKNLSAKAGLRPGKQSKTVKLRLVSDLDHRSNS